MYPKSYYPVDPIYAEKYHEISEHFRPEVENIIQSKPFNYKSWRKLYLLIIGEDTYEQYTAISGKNKIRSINGDKEDFLEYVTDKLMWYSLVFDYKTAKISLEESPPCGNKNVISSSRMGPKLNEFLNRNNNE
jgi:hypothetical protein